MRAIVNSSHSHSHSLVIVTVKFLYSIYKTLPIGTTGLIGQFTGYIGFTYNKKLSILIYTVTTFNNGLVFMDKLLTLSI